VRILAPAPCAGRWQPDADSSILAASPEVQRRVLDCPDLEA
jgi:hypothetical protein